MNWHTYLNTGMQQAGGHFSYHFWLGATANPTKSNKKMKKKGQLVRVSFVKK